MPPQSRLHTARYPEHLAPLFRGELLSMEHQERVRGLLAGDDPRFSPSELLGFNDPYTLQLQYPVGFAQQVAEVSPQLRDCLARNSPERQRRAVCRWMVELTPHSLSEESCKRHVERVSELGLPEEDQKFFAIYFPAIVTAERGEKAGEKILHALQPPSYSTETKDLYWSALNEAAFSAFLNKSLMSLRSTSLLLGGTGGVLGVPHDHQVMFDLEVLSSCLVSIRGTIPLLMGHAQVLTPPLPDDTPLAPYLALHPRGFAHSLSSRAQLITYRQLVAFLRENQTFVAELVAGQGRSRLDAILGVVHPTVGEAPECAPISPLVGRAAEYCLTAEEVAGVEARYGHDAERRLRDPQLRFQSLVEAGIGEWANERQVVTPFRIAAAFFGAERIWSLVRPQSDVMRREHALRGVADATTICEVAHHCSEGRLTPTHLFNSLFCPGLNAEVYGGTSGASVFEGFLQVIAAKHVCNRRSLADVHREVLEDSILRQFNLHDEFPNVESIFETWKKFSKFFELLRMHRMDEVKDSMMALQRFEPETWRFVQALLQHPGCRVSSEAVTDFVCSSEAFFDREDSSFSYDQDKPRRPARIIEVPGLGLCAADLRRAITGGDLDQLCPLPTMETRSTVLLRDSNGKPAERGVKVSLEPRISALNAAAGDDVGDCAIWGQAKKTHYLLNPNTAQVIARMEVSRGHYRTVAEGLITIDELQSGHRVLAFDNIEVAKNYLKKPEVAEALRKGFRAFAEQYLERYGERLGVLPVFLVGEHPHFMKEGATLFSALPKIARTSVPRVPLLYSDKVASEVYILTGRPFDELPRVTRSQGLDTLDVFDAEHVAQSVGSPSARWPLTHALMGIAIGNARHRLPALSRKAYQKGTSDLALTLIAYPNFSKYARNSEIEVTIRAFFSRDCDPALPLQAAGELIEAVRSLGGPSIPRIRVVAPRGAVSDDCVGALEEQLPSDWRAQYRPRRSRTRLKEG